MADEKDAQSERPPDSDFQQQNLKAWQPLLTPGWVIGTFLLIGCLFVPIGAIVLSASQDVVEVFTKYDDLANPCPPEQQNRDNCGVDVTLTIDKDMKAPVYMYYKLTNFYQNHRRYVKSRSDAQLRGSDPSDITSCEPLEKWEGKNLYPCGLIANSYFNDTFKDSMVTTQTGSKYLNWTDNGIAWESDKDKFKKGNFDPATQTRKGPSGHELPEDIVIREDFIVWMRTAGLPTFKKLRYILNGVDLAAGDKVTFKVDNVFPVKEFSGEKFIVLSTTSWLGGKNDFLGLAYIIVGSLCLLLAAVFFLKHRLSPRPLGKMEYFNWTKNAASR